MPAEPETLKRPMRPMAIVVVALHIALLAAYTLPHQFVPTRVRYWSQAYARVLFHQDWRLFAPDPPECGCSVEYKGTQESEWRRLEDLHHHFIWRRMAANACRFVEASMEPPDSLINTPLTLDRSLERMAMDVPRKGELDLRLHRICHADEFTLIRRRPHR